MKKTNLGTSSLILIIVTLALLTVSLTSSAATIEVTAQIGETGCDLVEAIDSANADEPIGDCIANNGSFGDDLIVLNFTVPITEFIVSEANFVQMLPSKDVPYGLPEITSNIRIIGRSRDDTLITIKRSNAIDTPTFALFYVSEFGNLTLQNISLQNGHNPEASGGAIYILGGDFISDSSEFINNRSAQGGAISAVAADVVIRSSLIEGNQAQGRPSPSGGVFGAPGGAIVISGGTNLSIYDTTISGNMADDEGGAITSLGNGVDLAITNTTISNNHARTGGGISFNSLTVAGADDPSTLRIMNSIITGNTALFTSDEFEKNNSPSNDDVLIIQNNLFGHAGITTDDASDGTFDLSTSILATSDGDTPTAQSEILLPLSNNGGPTRTHALPANSPAIDQATDGIALNFLLSFYLPGCRGTEVGPITPLPAFRPDQRGIERPSNASCDIGSYEFEKDDSCYVIKAANENVVAFCL